MRRKNPELKQKIKEFVETYYKEQRRSPSLRTIGAAVGLNYVSVQKYLKEMDAEQVLKYEPLQKVTPGSCPVYEEGPHIPLLGGIPCGPAWTEEGETEEYIDIPGSWAKENDDLYFLRAKGDSMIGAQITDGDLLLMRKTDQAREGQIVAALLDHSESTLKRLMRDEKRGLYLHPENDRYSDIYPVESLEIQGVCIRMIRDME